MNVDQPPCKILQKWIATSAKLKPSSEQRQLIANVQARGGATTDAELALDYLLQALGVFKRRRQSILAANPQ
jgi:hypothetical protein